MAAGGYEPVAEKLFNTPVDAFLLEYDSERAGDFQPLRLVPRASALCSASSPPRPRNWRIRPACCGASTKPRACLPLDQLGLSTQCGFASVAGGNVLTEDEQ